MTLSLIASSRIRKNVFNSTIPSLHVSMECSGYLSGCNRIQKVNTWCNTMKFAILGMDSGNVMIQVVSNTIYMAKIFVTTEVFTKSKSPATQSEAKIPTIGIFIKSCIL